MLQKILGIRRNQPHLESIKKKKKSKISFDFIVICFYRSKEGKKILQLKKNKKICVLIQFAPKVTGDRKYVTSCPRKCFHSVSQSIIGF